jgi:DNA primase
VQKLLKLADHVVFSFDGDAPGQKAAWRALETSLPFVADGKSVGFLFLPEEDDPDTYVRRLGKSAFVAALQSAQPLSDLLLERLVRDHPPTGPEQKARLIEAAKPLIGQITAPVLLHFVQGRLAALLGVDRADLLSLMPQTNDFRRPDVRASDAPKSRVPRRTHPLAARILARLISFPQLSQRLPATLAQVPELASVAEIARFIAESDGSTNTGVLLQCFAETEHERAIEEALKDPLINDTGLTADDAVAELDEFIERVRRDSRRSELVARQLSGLTAEERAELDAIGLGG